MPTPPIDSLEPGEAVWRIAMLFPPQGSWTERDYLDLDGGVLVDFDNGVVEVHDMPTIEHQRIVRYLFQLLAAAVQTAGWGEVFFAPLPMHLWSGKYREPDLMVVRHDRPRHGDYPQGAELVAEVLSQGPVARRRDLETKVEEYAKAGIKEYWIIDPEQQRILRYELTAAGSFAEPAIYVRGESATSTVLPTLTVDVTPALESATAAGDASR